MLMVFIGFLFISLIGILFNYLAEKNKKPFFLRWFTSNRDSSWEHIKVALSAYYIWFIFSLFINGNNPNFWLSELIGCVTIILFIPAIFYSYIRVTKKSIAKLNILTFLITVLISQLFTYRVLNYAFVYSSIIYVSMISFGIIFGIYLLGLIVPKNNSIFNDPVIKRYNIKIIGSK